jgi:hypothetical protein
MNTTSSFIAEQRRTVTEPRPDLVEIPVQDQVQPVEHRHPPGPGTGRLGALAEPHMYLPERSTTEVQIRTINRRSLFGS